MRKVALEGALTIIGDPRRQPVREREREATGGRRMEGIFGMLAVAGGFGLAYGLTVLGLNAVIAVMPRKNSGRRPSAG